ncbi:MAG: right-handed parallel beta-helix repeat-containing protein, partial [Anaerolineaceae bacterium]|nr:right-handed parallel beta-helix repeat-containing protein [Anaerolineaceae bacterium]
ADPDDTIIFDSGLSGEVILSGLPLEINKNLVIDGSSLAVPITIDGGGSGIVFSVDYTESGVVATLDSLIIQNGDSLSGGGIYIESNSNLTVANCTLSGNHSTDGGGILKSGGTLTVVNSNFSGNSAENWGGGIWNSSGTLTVTNSTFSGNSASVGGGIMNFRGTLTVTDSTFSGNSADDFGGGGIFNADGTLTVTNSTFSGNSGGGGGGIYNYGTLTVTNSTFSGNSAVYGGGIYNLNGTLNYVNTIIANSMTGYDCYNDGDIGINSKNWVEDDSCSPEFIGDPLLGPLADNGGPTQTHALLSGSGAIDQGDNAACPTTDQRGVTRPVGAGCDIGSYEYALFIYLPMVLK